jgi:NADPH2:quinone reductase
MSRPLSYRLSISNARPRSGEVLVEIKASAINPSDVGNVAGAFQAELPRVPGRDFAGVVVEGGGDEWNGK